MPPPPRRSKALVPHPAPGTLGWMGAAAHQTNPSRYSCVPAGCLDSTSRHPPIFPCPAPHRRPHSSCAQNRQIFLCTTPKSVFYNKSVLTRCKFFTILVSQETRKATTKVGLTTVLQNRIPAFLKLVYWFCWVGSLLFFCLKPGLPQKEGGRMRNRTLHLISAQRRWIPW